jgi:acetyltransferase-like isoleucine patch superfamily enzyme
MERCWLASRGVSKSLLAREIMKTFWKASLKKMLLKVSVKQRSEKYGELNVDGSSIVDPNRITLKKECSLVVERDSQVDGVIICEREQVLIKIGKRTFMNGTIIAAQEVNIGDDVLISWGVTIVDHNSHSVAFSERARDVQDWRLGKKDWSNVKIAPVNISDKTWIGFNAIILKGVSIGEGAIIGAGSVVTKDVPAWTIAAGNPARIIRAIPEDER